MTDQQLLERIPAPAKESPDTLAWEAQRNAILHEALDELTALQQITILLRYRDDETYAAIARAMDIPESTIYAMHRRALSYLKTRLEEKGIADANELGR